MSTPFERGIPSRRPCRAVTGPRRPASGGIRYAPRTPSGERRARYALEFLEQREMLASDLTPASFIASGWHNSANPVDVNNDGVISPLDVALVVSYLTRNGAGPLPQPQLQASSAALVANASSSGTTTAAGQGDFLDVNNDGFVSPIDLAQVVSALSSPPIVKVSLQVADLSDNPITQINAGQSYEVEAFVQDERTTGTLGVFAAYVSASYLPALSTIASNATPTFGATYNQGEQFGFATPGLISNTGAFTLATSLDNNPHLLWKVTVRAAGAGTQTFTPGPADASTGHDVEMISPGGAVDPASIDFVNTSINVIGVPAISVSDATVTEVASPLNTSAVFTVSMSTTSNQTVKVDYATMDGTATQPADYMLTSGTLTFLPGMPTTQNVTVQVQGNATPAPSSKFYLSLTNPQNGQITTALGTATIQPPTLSIGDVDMGAPSAGLTNFVFPVTLSAPVSIPFTVAYATQNQTAVAGINYQPQSSQLTFAPGQTLQFVTVPVIGNSVTAGDETFLVNLSSPTGGIGISHATGLGTIVSGANVNDTVQVQLVATDQAGNPLATLSVGQSFLLEGIVDDLRNVGAAGGVLSAYMNVAFPSNVAIVTGPISYGDGTDYLGGHSGDTSTAGQINHVGAFDGQTPLGAQTPKLLFSVPMQATGTGSLAYAGSAVPVAPGGDPLQFAFTVYGQNTAVPASAIDFLNSPITVQNTANSIAITPSVAQAPGTNFVFDVTRFDPNNTTATVSVSTADITAHAPGDYQAIPTTTLTFGPGVNGQNQTQHVTIVVNPNSTRAPDEKFAVNLSNPTNAALGGSQGIGTILLSANALPTISIANAAANEGLPVTFTVTLSQSSGFPVTVAYATADGAGSTGAKAGTNYTTTSGTLTFAAGTTTLTQTISVPTIAVLNQPGDLNFSITLTPTNATISGPSAIGTIHAVVLASISGSVYFDSNSNGVFNPSEKGIAGVMLTAVQVGGAFSASTVTAADGSYHFINLQPGTYNVVETHPGFYVDGLSAPAPSPIVTSVDQFSNIPLITGQAQAGLNFPELGLRGDLASAFLAGRAFLASSAVTGTTGLPPATNNMNLSQGEIWVSLDGGWQGLRKFEALYNTSQGSATLQLYDNNLNLLATSTGEANGSVLIGNGVTGATYFLRISGNSPNASLKITESASVANAAVVQSNSTTLNELFTVSLSAPVNQVVTVHYATADGSAVDGVDYTSTTGMLTFQPGVLTQTVSVPILPGTKHQANQSFSLNLSNPTNAFVGVSPATGTIINSFPAPTLAIADASVVEPTSGTANAVFNVTLNAVSGLPVVVTYTTVGGSALAGTDFVAQTGTFTIAPGSLHQAITVVVTADPALVSDETFSVKLTSVSGATPVRSLAQGTITASSSFVVAGVVNGTAAPSTSATVTPVVTNPTLFSAGSSTTSASPAVGLQASSQTSASSNSSQTSKSTSTTQATDSALASESLWFFA